MPDDNKYNVTLSSPAEPEFERVEGDDIKDLRQAWADGDSFFEKLGNTITKTVAGRNTVGRVAGMALDIGLGFIPYGEEVQKIRQKGKILLGQHPDRFKYQSNDDPMIKKAIMRAFTSDGGGRIRLKDEDGNYSMTSVIAGILRALVILALLYAGNELGIPVGGLLDVFG